MATTTNYSWETPDDTDLVKDGAAAMRTLGSSIDTTTKNLNPSTTLGDIEYRSSTANTNTRLAIGTSGQVLTVSGGVPAWGTVSSGGYTLLSTTTFSGSTTSITSISQDYTFLFIYWINVYNSADDENLNVRFNSDSSSKYNTSGYLSRDSSGITQNGTFQGTSFIIGQLGNDATADRLNSGNMFIYNYTSTGNKSFNGSSRNRTNTQWVGYRADGSYTGSSAISSIQFSPSGGTFSGGTAYVYGVK